MPSGFGFYTTNSTEFLVWTFVHFYTTSFDKILLCIMRNYTNVSLTSSISDVYGLRE